jgi:2-keto-4-pentenoate hydratase
MTTLVDILVAGHRTLQQAEPMPELEPADDAAAYAMQVAVAQALGAEVAGWKVGMRPDGTAVAGPLYKGLMRANGATWTLPGVGNPLVCEVEVAFRLERDLPPRAAPYTRADIQAAVAEVVVGIELVRGRFGGPAGPPARTLLADNMVNAGYVAGDSRKGLGNLDVARLRCRYSLDGKRMHDAVGGHPQDDPFAPIAACANAGNLPLGGLCAGQLITTGTLVPPFRVTEPVSITAELEGVGSVSLRMVA